MEVYDNLRAFSDIVKITTKNATIIGKIYSINKIEEIDSADRVTKLKSSFQDANIEMMDSEGQYRGFYALMDELKEKWNSLSDSVQADFMNAYEHHIVYVLDLLITENRTIRLTSDEIVTIDRCEERR